MAKRNSDLSYFVFIPGTSRRHRGAIHMRDSEREAIELYRDALNKGCPNGQPVVILGWRVPVEVRVIAQPMILDTDDELDDEFNPEVD